VTALEHPLRLAVGSHEAGSGKGCAMNVVSWESGDTMITDLPACADPMLARIVQRVNDTICRHRDSDLLCPACSMKVLDLAHRIVGSGTHPLIDLERHRVWVRVAADQARQVLHLTTAPEALAAIEAAERWCDGAVSAQHCRAAAAAAERLRLAHLAVDVWCKWAGFTPMAPEPVIVTKAIERMLEVAQ
jgi:hypothetical protein